MAAPAAASRKLAGGHWLHALWWPTLLIAAIFCLITFYAKGGLNLESMVSTEMALTIGAGVLIAACLLLAAPGLRAYGAWPAGLLLAFTVLTAVSIVWSVQPDHSWQDSGRMLAYTGVFAAGIALVRVVPDRWPAVLGGLTLAAVVVCAYALATQGLPEPRPLEHVRPLERTLRLLERGRADRGDGRDLLPVARLAAHRPRARTRVRLSRRWDCCC